MSAKPRPLAAPESCFFSFVRFFRRIRIFEKEKEKREIEKKGKKNRHTAVVNTLQGSKFLETLGTPVTSQTLRLFFGVALAMGNGGRCVTGGEALQKIPYAY